MPVRGRESVIGITGAVDRNRYHGIHRGLARCFSRFDWSHSSGPSGRLTRSYGCSLRHLDGVAPLGRSILHVSTALEFVPGEGTTLDGPAQRLDQHDGKQLPISEPLQPNLAEQPSVFASFGLTALQGKSKR